MSDAKPILLSQFQPFKSGELHCVFATAPTTCTSPIMDMIPGDWFQLTFSSDRTCTFSLIIFKGLLISTQRFLMFYKTPIRLHQYSIVESHEKIQSLISYKIFERTHLFFELLI